MFMCCVSVAEYLTQKKKNERKQKGKKATYHDKQFVFQNRHFFCKCCVAHYQTKGYVSEKLSKNRKSKVQIIKINQRKTSETER